MKTLRITCACGCQFVFEGEATPEKGYKCFKCGGPIKNKDAILDADGNEIVSQEETIIEATKSLKNEKIEKLNEKKKVRKEKKLLKSKRIKKERIK